MTKITKVLGVIILILSIICIILFLMNKKNNNTIDNQQNLIGALTDTVKIVRNKDSSTTAEIQSFSLTNSNLIQEIKNTKDEALIHLQDLEKQYRSSIKDGGSIVSTNSSTGINTSVKSNILGRDTFKSNDTFYIYPEYRGEINLGKWINGYSLANKDSTSYRISIHNESDVIVHKEDGKFVADIKLYNPYSETQSLRALNVEFPKPKRSGIGIILGYGAVLNQDEQKSKSIKLSPFMGLGFSYHLIEF